MSTEGIVTYPLGGITYDAEDAAAYFSTRTSGVYSTDEDFAVTPAGGTSVTVSAGRAWLHPSRWTGFSVTVRENTTLDLPLADSYLPRIDSIVLRYDATSRATTVQVLQGTASSTPTAPDISRTEMVYDLCLAEISRPAGQTTVTAANITDTRADDSLCGLMRDGVTGIPMKEMNAQALTKAQETADLCDKLLQSYTGGYLSKSIITLTADGWQDCTDVPGYAYKQTVELRAAREAHKPEAVPSPATYTAAISAGLAGVCETGDGSITFWAESVPEGDIDMLVSLLGESTGQSGEVVVSTTGITPEQYGAAGDGVTDDHAALTAAIEAASAQSQPLELKRGAVYLYKDLLELKDNVTIHGNGAVLLSDLQCGTTAADRAAVFICGRSDADQMQHIRLEDITFRAADTCETNTMLRCMRARDVQVRNCTFDCDINEMSRGCMDLYGVCNDFVFEGNVFRQLSACHAGGIWVRSWTSSAESSNIRFLHCDFYKAGGDEVLAVWGWNGVMRDVLISGCNFYEVDEGEYRSRGYYPVWGITLGQTGKRCDVRMENCVVRMNRCETLFRMLGDGTHAVVDNCDIYSDQPDDIEEHDWHKGAFPMLARGNNKADGSTLFSNCRIHLHGDSGRRICYQVSALRNNYFDVECGYGPASTKEVISNVFRGSLKGVIWDCNVFKDNVVELEDAGAWMSGAGDVIGNQITMHITADGQGTAVFHNNWGSGSILNNKLNLTYAKECDMRQYEMSGGPQFVRDNVINITGARFTYLQNAITGLIYRKNNFFNNTPEPLFECTGVSFAEDVHTEQYKKPTHLALTITPDNCTDPVVYTWSDADGALDIGEYGAYRPVKDGTASVMVSCGMFSASQRIKVALVPVPCEGLKLSRTVGKCGSGMKTYLKASPQPYWTTDDVVWSSDAEDVATVTQDGEVTALKVGSVNITATCGSCAATCALSVVDASELPTYTDGEWVLDNTVAYIAMPNLTAEHTLYMSFDVDTGCVKTSEELPLITSLLSGQTGQEAIRVAFGADSNSYKSVRWYTTDVDADEEGNTTLYKVTSINTGFVEGEPASTAFLYLPSGVPGASGNLIWGAQTSTVTAAPDSGYLSFNVQPADGDSPVTDYTNGAALELALSSGAVHATKATGFKLRELILFTNSSYSTLDEIKQYRESAEIDLRFDADGNVVNAGTAGDFIIAGKGGEIIPVESVTLDKSTLALTVGGSDTLTATVLPEDATDKTVQWSVSPEGFASLSAASGGTVTVSGTAEGSCAIKASAGGKSTECAVTVAAASGQNANPFPDITPTYLLPDAKTFSPETAEYIDTGVKMFESIDPKPNWTVLLEVEGGEDLAEKSSTYTLMHCMEEVQPWPGFVVQVAGTDIKTNMYGAYGNLCKVSDIKAAACRVAVRISGSTITGWKADGTSANWGTIPSYDTTVDKTLILGAYQESDGTKGRYFDGTLHQCVLYNSALTDEQISGWVKNQNGG